MSIHLTLTFQQHGAAAWRAQEAFHYSIHLTLTLVLRKFHLSSFNSMRGHGARLRAAGRAPEAFRFTQYISGW